MTIALLQIMTTMKKSAFVLVLILLLSTVSFAGNNKSAVLKGKVVDNHGEPIVGATVYVEESNTVVYTDFDGEFLINNPSQDKNTITVSMISYKEKKSIVTALNTTKELISIKLFSK